MAATGRGSLLDERSIHPSRALLHLQSRIPYLELDIVQVLLQGKIGGLGLRD